VDERRDRGAGDPRKEADKAEHGGLPTIRKCTRRHDLPERV
jgi:hypothetical protein